MRTLSLILLIFFGLGINLTCAEDNGSSNKEGEERKKSPVGIDLPLLVRSLRNLNEKPRIIGSRTIQFGKNYDFEEQRRIEKIIRVLILYTEEAWPELVGSLENQEYSCTFGYGSGAENYSVGNVCEQLIRNALSAGYYHCVGLLEGTDVRTIDLIGPEVIGTEKLRDWLKTRQSKRLFELQIITLDEIAKRLKSSNSPGITKNIFIEAILDSAKELEKEKIPRQIRFEFIPHRESWWYFSDKDAGK